MPNTFNTFKSMRPNFKESQTKKMEAYERGEVPGQEDSQLKPRFKLLSNFLKPPKPPGPPKPPKI